MEIHPLGSDLTHFPGARGQIVVPAEEGVEEGFEWEEVDLFVVWGEGGAARVVGVLDGGAAVGVVLDAEGGEECDGGVGGSGEGVGWGEVRCVD